MTLSLSKVLRSKRSCLSRHDTMARKQYISSPAALAVEYRDRVHSTLSTTLLLPRGISHLSKRLDRLGS